MSADVEIDRVLASVTATLNDQKLEEWDTRRVQELVTASLGGAQDLRVDEGGGLHNQSGVRVGAIRRTPSGEWITERQNEAAERADTAVPARPPLSRFGKLKKALGR